MPITINTSKSIRLKTAGTDVRDDIDIIVEGSGVSGLPIEIETKEQMSALLVEENVGKVYKYVGTDGTYTNGDLYEVVSE